MTNQNKSSSGGGICLSGLLGITFVTLKLCGVIQWSWWYVTLPFWGGFALLFVILLLCIIAQSLSKRK
jgi:hypothetical protein